MFYNVPKEVDSEAELWVESFINEHKLTEKQINGIRYTAFTAQKPSHDNMKYHTRYVQVTFPNEDFKGSTFNTLILARNIPKVKHLKVKDSFPKIYRDKVQQFDADLSNYRHIGGDRTFIKCVGLELKAWRQEEGKTWVQVHSWPPSPPSTIINPRMLVRAKK